MKLNFECKDPLLVSFYAKEMYNLTKPLLVRPKPAFLSFYSDPFHRVSIIEYPST